MRRVVIAFAVFCLLIAGTAGLLWWNRVPLAEWAIDRYQPETPLGPIAVRIGDITLSSVTIAEIRGDFRGPVSIQDIQADYSVGPDWHLTLSSLRIGSINAALSFADWFDLLETIAPSGPTPARTEAPMLPLSLGSTGVETLDVYVETPKGYALLNGALNFDGTVDFTASDAIARLVQNLEGELLLSAGAAGFPVQSGAMGGGSIVLTAALAEGTAKMEAITPIRFSLEVSDPLPAIPQLPVGTYRADVGSDENPFKVSIGYGIDPAPGLRTVIFEPFPFALDTPFGTAEARVTTAPMSATEAQDDPASLPIGLKGRLDLSGLPLPSGIVADVKGGFEIDKGKRTTLALESGFAMAADVSDSPLLESVPQAAFDYVGTSATITTDRGLLFELATGEGGSTVTGTGAAVVRSGAVTATLPSGFSLETPANDSLAMQAKTVVLSLAKGKTPVQGTASFAKLAAKIAADGSMVASAQYNAESTQARSKGFLALQTDRDRTKIELTGADIVLPGPDITIPAINASATLSDAHTDLSATLDEIRMGTLLALKRPLDLTAVIEPYDQGIDFQMTGAIDNAIAIKAKGTVAGGDVVMTFGSGDMPLGPDGADLSELTELVDLGRSDPNGSIRIEGELTYQNEAVSGYADLHIAEIGSVLTDGTEISVLGTVTFDLSRLPATMEPATLTGALNSDIIGVVPFKETFTLRETGEMEVQSLEAEFLGGTVTVREGLASATAGSLTGLLHAQAIDLNALAEMMNIEGLEGTGRLTGDLKFQIREDTVIVEAGALSAEQPGVLKYRGEALRAAASGNENLELLVRALEDFHYDVLTLGIDIPEFGEGVVTLHLEGSNPEVLEGYPFDVTINLESEYGRLIKTFLNLYKEMDVILQGAVR